MTKLRIVANTGGGVGKTLLSMTLAEMLSAAGATPIVLDADDKSRAGSGDTPLARALPGHTVIWLGAGPSADDLDADDDALSAHWDKVGSVAAQHDAILDLGANTLKHLCAYAMRMRVADRWSRKGIEIEAWVPFTAVESAFTEGLKGISMIQSSFGSAAKVLAVRNLRDGGFTGWAGSPQEKALSAFQKAGVRIVEMPKCRAPAAGMAAMYRAGLSPFGTITALLEDEDGLATKLGLPVDIAVRTAYSLQDWTASLYTELGDVLPGKQQVAAQ